MKDSSIEWIGEIPDTWETGKTLFALSMPITDGPHETPELFNDGIPFVSAEAVSTGNGKINFSNIRGFISEEFYEECCKKYIPKINDVYMIKSGATTGRVAVVDTDKKFTIWSLIAVFRCDSNKYYYKFLYYFLKSDAYQKQIENKWSYGTQQNIGMRVLEKLILCFPALNEQTAIADYLDKKCAAIDTVIEKEQQVIEKLTEYKQSVITEAVTKGLNPDVPMKDSGIEWIGEIPAGWNVKSLRYVGTCQNGISKGGDFFGTGFPFISYSDVYKNMKLPEQGSGLVESDENEQENYSVQRGDIFFTRTSETIEEIGLTSVCLKTIDKATFAGFLIRVRPYDNQIIPEFSAYYFRSNIHRQFFVKEMNLVTRASLGQELLKRLPVLLPSLSEQTAIANYLDKKCASIDNIIAKKQQLIDKLTEYKKSLIYEMVTGKKEVPLC